MITVEDKAHGLITGMANILAISRGDLIEMIFAGLCGGAYLFYLLRKIYWQERINRKELEDKDKK